MLLCIINVNSAVDYVKLLLSWRLALEYLITVFESVKRSIFWSCFSTFVLRGEHKNGTPLACLFKGNSETEKLLIEWHRSNSFLYTQFFLCVSFLSQPPSHSFTLWLRQTANWEIIWCYIMWEGISWWMILRREGSGRCVSKVHTCWPHPFRLVLCNYGYRESMP
jgi:hypothetical protein